MLTAITPDPFPHPGGAQYSYRAVGVRMVCHPCELAWTGGRMSRCWICDSHGVIGPPPSIYDGGSDE